jgi:hypothetical protein
MRSDRIHFIHVIFNWLLERWPQPTVSSAPVRRRIGREIDWQICLNIVVENTIEARYGALQIVPDYRRSKDWRHITFWLPSEIRDRCRDPQPGEKLSVTAQIVSPDRFEIKGWSVVAPNLAAVSASDGPETVSEELGWSEAVKRVLQKLWPLWPLMIWVFVVNTVVTLTSIGAISARSYDYLGLGSLVWLSVHSSVICWHRISAARTDVRLGLHESRTSRVRRCLAEAWRVSTRDEWFVVICEIAFCVYWLVVSPSPFT